jgi:dephospho-CoA kinase
MGKIAVLNRITHPVIKKEIRKKISEAKAKNNVTAIVVEVPLLFESKMDKWFQKIIVVECDNVTQIKRAKKRSNISEEEILCRIKNQIPLEEKVKKADFVVDNNMPRKLVEKQVDDIMKMLK